MLISLFFASFFFFSQIDTALGNEVLRKSRQEYTELPNSVILSGYFNSAEANSNTLTESGFFDASSGGNLIIRFLISFP